MTRRTATIPPDYFESLYRSAGDPWGFLTSDYERGKYAETLAALTKPRYDNALEVGCSIGVFTQQLAARCGAVLAVDASDTALATARQACAASTHVTLENRIVPAAFPEGRFDLILLSEVLYYLDRTDLAAMAERCSQALTPDGEVILCHWLGETDYPLTGQEASDLFVKAMAERLPSHVVLHDDTYRLDRLSVA